MSEVISWEKSLEQGRAVSLSLDYGDEDPTIKFTVFGNDSARVLNLGAEEARRIAEELGRFGDQLALIHEGGSE